MKALTVCQPYASLIVGWEGCRAEDLKRVENRPKIYNYRGPLLIHAGLSTKWLATWDGPQPTGQKMPFGALVGIVDVVMCMHIISVQNAPDDSVLGWVKHHRHASGPFCLVLKRPRRFVEPIPYRGNQGLFDVPPEVYTEQPFVGSLCASAPLRENSSDVTQRLQNFLVGGQAAQRAVDEALRTSQRSKPA